jgi:hypothetical protein
MSQNIEARTFYNRTSIAWGSPLKQAIGEQREASYGSGSRRLLLQLELDQFKLRGQIILFSSHRLTVSLLSVATAGAGAQVEEVCAPVAAAGAVKSLFCFLHYSPVIPSCESRGILLTDAMAQI